MAGLTPLRTARSLVDAAAKRLSTSTDGALDAEMLFRGVSGLSRAELLARGNELVDESVAARFDEATARRERHEPIQYILGIAAFWRDDFIVNESVLIPRPETEILVEAVIARLRARRESRILDIGTGSGCIALSLLRDLSGATAVAVDLSEAALAVAGANAERLGLASRVEFRQSRWLDSIGADEAFDAVVSNPPYVAPADEASLPRAVREFEPALALYAEPDDEISSYRAIAARVPSRLIPQGLIALEVGFGQAERVASLLDRSGFTGIETLNDLAGIARVVLGRR